MTFKPEGEPKPAHGNTTGLRRHYKNNEMPCDECRQAGSDDSKARRNARRRAMTQAFDDLLDVISGECRRAGMLP